MKGKKLSKKAVFVGILIIVVCIGAVLYSMVGDKIGVPSAEELIDGAFGAEPCSSVEYAMEMSMSVYTTPDEDFPDGYLYDMAFSGTYDVDEATVHQVVRSGIKYAVADVTTTQDMESYTSYNSSNETNSYINTDSYGWTAVRDDSVVLTPDVLLNRSAFDTIEMAEVSKQDTGYTVYVTSNDVDFIQNAIGLDASTVTEVPQLNGVLVFDKNSKRIVSITYTLDSDVYANNDITYKNVRMVYKPSKFNQVSITIPEECLDAPVVQNSSSSEDVFADEEAPAFDAEVESNIEESVAEEAETTEGEVETTEGEPEATETESEGEEPTE